MGHDLKTNTKSDEQIGCFRLPGPLRTTRDNSRIPLNVIRAAMKTNKEYAVVQINHDRITGVGSMSWGREGRNGGGCVKPHDVSNKSPNQPQIQ